MKQLLKTVCLITIIMQSCSTAKGTGTDAKETSTIAQSNIKSLEKMEEKGFLKGTLSANKSEGCPYVLTVEKYDDKLDPINIQDFFTKDMLGNVWVKYGNLRMQNRCNEARPISILEISSRKD